MLLLRSSVTIAAFGHDGGLDDHRWWKSIDRKITSIWSMNQGDINWWSFDLSILF